MFSPRTATITTSGGARAVSDDTFTDLELDYNNSMDNNLHQDQHSLPTVEQARTGISSSTVSKINKRRLLAQLGVVTGIVVVLFLIIIPVRMSFRQTNNNKTNTNNDTSSRFPQTLAYLEQHVDITLLTTSGSPQFRAAEWMADTDALALPFGERFLQRFALVAFYYSTQGTTAWKHSLKFKSTNHECDWNHVLKQGRSDDTAEDNGVSMGVFCNENQTVQQVVIDNMGLTGTLAPELSLLTSMTRLALPHNQIYGSLPQQLTQLFELTHLILNDNEFAQSLPSWMGDFINLQQLVLSNNGFYSSLPDEFEELEELALLALEDNHLTGNLDSLALLQQLEYLYVQGNQFTGTLDRHWMTTLVNLRTLDASNNLLDGNVPSQLLELSQLEVLDLHDNNLSGVIESVTRDHGSLQYLSLYNNRLTESIPVSLSSFPNLEHLDLSSNQFIGAIPSSLKTLTSLTYLYLSDNEYLDQGAIPEWIQDLTNLREFSLRKAERVGSIPIWLDELTKLQLLDLSENTLTSTIPPSLGYVESLRFLLLNRNHLNGTVPNEMSQLKNVELVMLDKNSLKGDLDETFCDKKLEVLTSDCKVPEVVCTCCSKCCSDADDSCNADYSIAQFDSSLETGYTREEYDLNPEHIVPAQ